MYCRKCGLEVPAGARFCPKCGNKMIDSPSPLGEESNNSHDDTNKTSSTITQGVYGSSIQMVEGILSMLLAVSVLFLPVVRVFYDTGYGTSSMLHVALNLSRFRFPGKYAPIGFILSIFMVFAFVGSLANAKQAFSNEFPQSMRIAGDIKISNSYTSLVTLYAIALIVLLDIARGNAYGIAGCSGWAWVLLFGGITCQAIHFVRWSMK